MTVTHHDSLYWFAVIAMFQLCEQLTVSTLKYTGKSAVASDYHEGRLL